jgi:small subunit ribosomal protein S6
MATTKLNFYEIILLIHPNQSSEVSDMLTRIQEQVRKNGGKVDRVEDWGRRPLEYSIEKNHKAHYVLLNIKCANETLLELKDSFKFNDNILRNMIIKRKKALTEKTIMYKISQDEANARKYHSPEVEYYNIGLLKKHIMESGRIIPARIGLVSTKLQRKICQAIKQARILSLLPYCDRHY